MTDKHKNPQYTLRIPSELMYKLRYIAGYYARSMNKEVELLIKRRISAFEKRNGDIPLDDFNPRSMS